MPIPAEKDTVVRTTARERVYNTLREWIVAGTLLPNERLNDVEIAHYFSVSRTPVREALQMLSEQKLVTMVPSSGTFVAPIDPEDLVYVYDMLAELQAHAIDLGISRFSQDDLGELHSINETFYHCSKASDPVGIITADRKFHQLIARASKNPYLITYTEQLMLQAHRNECRFFKEGSHLEQSYETHNHIIDALTSGDAQRAKELLRRNWQSSMEGV